MIKLPVILKIKMYLHYGNTFIISPSEMTQSPPKDIIHKINGALKEKVETDILHFI
jgi:hypothetical protein